MRMGPELCADAGRRLHLIVLLDEAESLACFLRQVAYLRSALLGRALLDPRPREGYSRPVLAARVWKASPMSKVPLAMTAVLGLMAQGS